MRNAQAVAHVLPLTPQGAAHEVRKRNHNGVPNLLDTSTSFISSAVRGAAPRFRREVTLDQPATNVVRAILELTALGVVEASIGTHRVGDDLLTPGWSSFDFRLRSVSYEVAPLITSERFVLGFLVGAGWYRGRLGWQPGTPPYGQEPAIAAILSIDFLDGRRQVVRTNITDGEWTTGPSEVTFDSLYDGQTIDAGLRSDEWSRLGFSGKGWQPARHFDGQAPTIEPAIAPPIRRIATLQPSKIWTAPSGATLVDFGENVVGFVRMRTRGPRGAVMTLRHAEVLDNGELALQPLRTARAEDNFVLSGGDDEFEPTFTFHGFRYVQVDGWTRSHKDLASSMEAVVISSDVRRTGWLTTNHPELNQLLDNVVRGMRGNFVDVPTDCPQRDERLGWTGDIAVFAETATFIGDVKTFLQDWLRDLAAEQRHAGFVPLVVPDILKFMPDPPFAGARSVAFWSDAAVWVPWALWRAYGDKQILAENFPSMVDHVLDVHESLSPSGIWDQGVQLGDWLDPDADPHRPDDAKADRSVVATAAAYRSAILTHQAAIVLGETSLARRLESIAATIRAGFNSEFVGTERITSDCTTVYSLALAFGLLPPEDRHWAGRRLAELVRESDYRISTGFAGTPYILDALTDTGHLDVAYKLLEQRECPSWLYPVTMGATTIWERWDSMRPDGSINPGEMTSFNHYALGAVADWMHRTIGGIAPLAPGYREVLVAPKPGGSVTHAAARLEIPTGQIRVDWSLTDGLFDLTVQVPPATKAQVHLTDGSRHEVGPGRHHYTSALTARGHEAQK